MNKNHIKQSGVVPYYIDKGIKKIILVTAKNSNKNWIVPKGHIEKGMSPQLSAAKEAFEEAGIKGEVGSKVIGTLSYSKKNKKCKVDFFAFKVSEILDNWPEKDLRERIVVQENYVKKFILDEKLLKIIKKACPKK
ncbi:NUDIX hydrolase [bacterium]|nr:NUDIX hydrolase [bacterium]